MDDLSKISLSPHFDLTPTPRLRHALHAMKNWPAAQLSVSRDQWR
jgi:hypothetical protein